jgi:hypothetical protein
MPLKEGLLVLKVRGRKSIHIPDQESNVVGFHGVTPQATKRRKAGEVFEILATAYKPQKSYWKGPHDSDKRVQVNGDPRDAICEFMQANRGWTEEMCNNYRKFQHFDPETMDLLEDQETPIDVLPPDHLLKLDETSALSAAATHENLPTVAAWFEAEKKSAKPRKKVLEILKAVLGDAQGGDPGKDLTGTDSTADDALLKLNAKNAIKAIVDCGDPKVLEAWLSTEQKQPQPRKNVVDALQDALEQ